MSMSLLATTPGNRLVMPRSSTAAGGLDALMAHSPGGKGLRRGGQASATLARQLRATRVELTHCYGSTGGLSRPPRRARVPAGTVRSAGLDLDGAVDDLLLRLVQLGLDVVDEATAGGEADTALGEGVDLVAGQRLAVVDGLDEVVDADVDVLDHRGQDRVLVLGQARDVVLARVHADGPGALDAGDGLDRAVAGGAGRGVDHVDAVVELAGRGFLALVGAGEAGGVRAVGQVLGVDLHLRVGVVDALREARLELLDQRDIHTADEADVVLLGLQRRGDTGEVGALLLGERDAVDVLGGRD